MLATQLNELVTSERLVKFSVARVGECVARLASWTPPHAGPARARYLCNMVQNRKCVPRRAQLGR